MLNLVRSNQEQLSQSGRQNSSPKSSASKKKKGGNSYNVPVNIAGTITIRMRMAKDTRTKGAAAAFFSALPAGDISLFYSQTFSQNDDAIKAMDAIMNHFFETGGWSQCFGTIYAIEANIPQDLNLYIPSDHEELYNWVNCRIVSSRLVIIFG